MESRHKVLGTVKAFESLVKYPKTLNIINNHFQDIYEYYIVSELEMLLSNKNDDDPNQCLLLLWSGDELE